MESIKYPWSKAVPLNTTKIESDDDIFLTIEKWPKEVYTPHFHESFNWIIPMRAGEVIIRVEEQEIPIDGQQWICLFPHTIHTIVHVSDNMEVFGLFIDQEDMFRAYQKIDPFSLFDL